MKILRALLFLAATIGISQLAMAADVYDINIVELAGRPGHQGLFPISGSPIAGSNAVVRARVNGIVTYVTLILRDQNGGLLLQTPMTASSSNGNIAGLYYATIIVPTVPYVMSINATDSNGNAAESAPKVNNATVDPQKFSTKLTSSTLSISPNIPVNLSANIINLGNTDSFTATISDNLGGIFLPNTQSISIGKNATTDLSFSYTPPPTLAPTDIVTVTVTVTSSTTGNNNTSSLDLHPDIVHVSTSTLSLFSKNNFHGKFLICNDGGVIDSKTISLNNSLKPTALRILSTSDHKQKSYFRRTTCTASMIEVKFDLRKLYQPYIKTTNLKTRSAFRQILVTAYGNDPGYKYVGYFKIRI